MPCRSYESDDKHSYYELKKHTDKLARMLCNAMTAIKDDPALLAIILKDKELNDWWTKHIEDDRKEKERIEEENRRKKVKRDALSKLTEEEKLLLGIKE